MAIKRLHYFNHQFLVEADFTDEQKYHLEMRRRLNRALHTFGIAEGLEVVKKTNKIVTVKPGVAIDRLGKEMVLEEEKDIELSAITTAVPAFITIAYFEEPTDPSTATGAPGKTRFTEHPTLQAVTTPPPTDGSVIRLASIPLTAGGNAPGNVNDAFDGGVRQKAGPRGEQGLASIDGVTNPGGDVDLIPAQAIVITSNNIFKKITIGENHSARTDNPHNVSANQIGALSTSGGTVNGTLHLNGPLNLSNDGSSDRPAIQTWQKPPSANPAVLAIVTDNLSTLPSFRRSAVAGVTDIAGVHGVYATAKAGTHALFVEGTANFTGAKTGYVVDLFINASGQKLRTGDVVKLKGAPARRFQGDNNKIPVAEVTLCDQDDDSLTIGIVDREAMPDPDRPDTRVEPKDPTFIANGGELYVVTLGAYAHCKVDATVAPIEVGDLLTTSSNPGHARKATAPRLGSIIGKALEPLKEGVGYIAVFVNIQ